MEPGIWGVSDLGEGVFLLGKGPLVGFLGKIGISAKRTEGRGDFLEALRSDGGEGPIFWWRREPKNLRGGANFNLSLPPLNLNLTKFLYKLFSNSQKKVPRLTKSAIP